MESKDFNKIQQDISSFYKKYGSIISNKYPYDAKYFENCQYKNGSGELMRTCALLPFYRLEIIDKYKDYFVFHRPDPNPENFIILELVFNFQDHFHLFLCIAVRQILTKYEIVAAPLIYTDDMAKVSKFLEDNRDFEVYASEKINEVGFGIFK